VNSHSTVEPSSPERTDIANYGPNRSPRDVVADFLLGGNRKRLIIEQLADDDGKTAADLVSTLRIGRATVFEVIRALHAADAVDDLGEARYRLAKRKPLGSALRQLVAALATGGNKRVSRPPRPSRPHRVSTRRG
jgi:hypothetical protein